MKYRKLFYCLLPGLVALSACSKYLDVKPKGVIIARSINDFEAILNDVDIVNAGGIYHPLTVTDDVADLALTPQDQQSVPSNLYFWRPYINMSSEKPDIWLDFYYSIANLNVITEGVMDAENGTEQRKRQVYAEAMVGKAYCYYHLLSFFAPAYDKATAAGNYGVPIVVSTDISVPTPARPSLEQAMQQLTGDLLAAIPDLGNTNTHIARATKWAAYGLLSRLYLGMGEYDKALQYADSVIEKGGFSIVDYSQFAGAGALPASNSSPEEVYVRYMNNVTFRYSDDLLSKYDTARDLRIRLFARRNIAADPRALVYSNFQQYNPNRGITYAEILLNRAECLARKGDVAGAMEIVNEDIRRKRFRPADYAPLTAADKEAAIGQVLAERRRELAFKGVRWSDIKRLDRENRIPAIKRYAADRVTVLETLEPQSLRHTFQIPLQVQAFNPGMPLNKQ